MSSFSYRQFEIIVLGFLLFVSSVCGNAELEADKMEFSEGAQIATGNALLKDKNLLLKADQISYKNNTAYARGNVTFTKEDLRIAGEKLEYNLQNGNFSGKKLRVGKWPVYMEAEELKGSQQLYEARNAIFHYGEPERFSPRIQAGRLGYQPENERYFVEKARFQIGDYPLFTLPRGSYSTKKYPFDFIGEVGLRKQVGAYALLEPSLYQGEEFILKPGVELYEKRGVLLKPSVEFLRTGDALTRSDLSFSWIRDQSDDPPLYSNTIPDDRYHWDWQYDHLVEGLVHAKVKVSWLSDEDFLRDFRPDFFRNEFGDDSFAEASYHRDNLILSSFFRLQPNSFTEYPQRLPDIRADLLANPISDTGFIQRGHAALAWLRDDTLNLDNKRFDAYYGLSYEWPTATWFSITPLAGARVTKYYKSETFNQEYTRVLGEFGLDAEIFAHATSNYSNDIWGIDGLRHIVKGTAQYRYIPQAAKGTGSFPSIEKQIIEYNMPLLGLSRIPNLDELGDMHTTRIGFENRFETRSAEYGSRQLAGLNIYQDILPDHKTQKLETTYFNATLSPASWLDLAFTARMPSRTGKIDRVSSEILLRDGDKMDLHFANEYLLQGNRQNWLFANYEINRENLLAAGIRYDSQRNEFTEQSYVWSKSLGRNWILDNSVILREGNLREFDFNYRIAVRLKSF